MSLRILVAYSKQSFNVQTLKDYVHSIKQYTGMDVRYVHVTHNSILDFDINDFDIVFHNYCARLCFEGYVSQDYIAKISKFKGLKVVSVQDDYDRTNTLHQSIIDLGFHVVLTTIPDDVRRYAYPTEKFRSVEFVRTYTGYVSDEMGHLAESPIPLAERKVLFAYRGRDIGGRYGRLGREKYEIGAGVRRLCEEKGLPHDIAMDEASRIYGADWYTFLGRARAILASESGSNVWDFDGSIERQFKELGVRLGRTPTYDEFEPYVAGREAETRMGQIAPRHFECALVRTPMVMFPGRYSDILAADEHYIPIERDFSNFDEVVERLNDIPALEAMCDRAYARLVAGGDFTYREFGRQMRELFLRKHAEIQAGTLRIEARKAAKPQTFQPRVAETLKEPATELPLDTVEFDIGYNRYLDAVYGKNQVDRKVDEVRTFLRASDQALRDARDALSVTVEKVAPSLPTTMNDIYPLKAVRSSCIFSDLAPLLSESVERLAEIDGSVLAGKGDDGKASDAARQTHLALAARLIETDGLADQAQGALARELRLIALQQSQLHLRLDIENAQAGILAMNADLDGTTSATPLARASLDAYLADHNRFIDAEAAARSAGKAPVVEDEERWNEMLETHLAQQRRTALHLRRLAEIERQTWSGPACLREVERLDAQIGRTVETHASEMDDSVRRSNLEAARLPADVAASYELPSTSLAERQEAARLHDMLDEIAPELAAISGAGRLTDASPNVYARAIALMVDQRELMDSLTQAHARRQEDVETARQLIQERIKLQSVHESLRSLYATYRRRLERELASMGPDADNGVARRGVQIFDHFTQVETTRHAIFRAKEVERETGGGFDQPDWKNAIQSEIDATEHDRLFITPAYENIHRAIHDVRRRIALRRAIALSDAAPAAAADGEGAPAAAADGEGAPAAAADELPAVDLPPVEFARQQAAKLKELEQKLRQASGGASAPSSPASGVRWWRAVAWRERADPRVLALILAERPTALGEVVRYARRVRDEYVSRARTPRGFAVALVAASPRLREVVLRARAVIGS